MILLVNLSSCDDSSSNDNDGDKGVVETTGSLSVTVSWPAGTVTSPSIEATITPDGAATESITFSLAGDSLSANYTMNGIEAGDYTLSIELKDYSTSLWNDTRAITIPVNDTETISIDLLSTDIASFSVVVSTFDDLTLAEDSYWNGDDDGAGYDGTFSGFISGDCYFTNCQCLLYNYWEAFSYSNMTDTTTEGFTNQFSAYTGVGFNDSANYAVAYTLVMWGQASQIYFGYSSGDYNRTAQGFYVTNTTYAALSMLNGDGFAKKFGDDPDTTDIVEDDQPDWFLLTIYALNDSYERDDSNKVEFYLADYRFDDSADDYIVDEWTWVDLTGLGEVYGLEFKLTSSDTGGSGMNTPAYFAMDNLVLVDNE